MTLYHLRPEVPGRLAEGTVRDQSVWPPLINAVHFEFQDWFGDDLLTSFPVFLISPEAGGALQDAGLDGFELADAGITIEEGSEDLVDPRVTTFKWLKVTGAAGQAAVGFDDRAHLIVDDAALEVLQRFQLDQCAVEEWTAPDA